MGMSIALALEPVPDWEKSSKNLEVLCPVIRSKTVPKRQCFPLFQQEQALPSTYELRTKATSAGACILGLAGC